jgi:hypothetical protein
VSERYKVLSAILALREFTVPEVANFSGVKRNTVRTVLAREPNLLDEVSKDHTGSRGGRFTRYRLKEREVEGLTGELSKIYLALQKGVIAGPRVADKQVSSHYEPPLRVLAAEDALIRRFPLARTSKEKLALIEFSDEILVKLQLELTSTEPAMQEYESFELLSLRALRELCSVELIQSIVPDVVTAAPPIFRDWFSTIADQATNLGQTDRGLGILQRFMASPLLGMEPGGQFVFDIEFQLIPAFRDAGFTVLADCLLDLRGLVAQDMKTRQQQEGGLPEALEPEDFLVHGLQHYLSAEKESDEHKKWQSSPQHNTLRSNQS